MRYESEYLMHHGIKGQKWGVRRYQNLDGSLTNEGRQHWGVGYGTSGERFNRFGEATKKLLSQIPKPRNRTMTSEERAQRDAQKAAKKEARETKKQEARAQREAQKAAQEAKKQEELAKLEAEKAAKAEAERKARADPSEMTDQELRDAINRLNLEKQYKTLVKEIRLNNESNNKDSNKKNEKSKNHSPVLKKVLARSAEAILSAVITKTLQDKADEFLAPKRKRYQENRSWFYNGQYDKYRYFKS